MSEYVCTCGENGHAINCPLRSPVTITPVGTVTPIGPAPFPSKDWQDGYQTGFAAGLAAAQQPLQPHVVSLTTWGGQ